MIIPPNSKLLMIGDSITDCGRMRPVGEGLYDGLGNGYVSLVDGLLRISLPDHPIRVVNMGTSGNTTRDLARRWQADVLDMEPDWLSVMIGINDVWRQFDSPLQKETHVLLDEYRETLDRLLQQAAPRLKGLLLMTPYFIESNRSDPMRALMDRYGMVVRELAEKYKAGFIDTQAAFDELLQHVHPMALAGDRVHPNLGGHLLLARAFLNALGEPFQPLLF